VGYQHIQLVAKELPSLDNVREVAACANAFWAQHPQQHVAIHCAYGAWVWVEVGGGRP
jgi:hypothetical protein